MRVVSTNIAKPQILEWKGKKQRTGIFKEPAASIYLEKQQVRGDEISNRKVHGGIFKACYLFSADHYDHWKELYPNLKWNYGMLGENITVEGLDETSIHVGDIYRLGSALIQVTQPREPCSTFGAKIGDQGILKKFIEHGRPGTYVRILEEGEVKVDDELILVEKANDSLSTADLFRLIFDKDQNKEHLDRALKNEAIPLEKRLRIPRS